MTPTTYGYKNPDNGDTSKGALGWMAAWLFNWTRIDGHSHNGIDSALLSTASFATPSVTAPNASWIVSGSGYKQTVTTPALVGDVNNFVLKFVIASGALTGQSIYLQYNRLTPTTFDLLCNDNTIDILCVFR